MFGYEHNSSGGLDKWCTGGVVEWTKVIKCKRSEKEKNNKDINISIYGLIDKIIKVWMSKMTAFNQLTKHSKLKNDAVYSTMTVDRR